MKLSDILPLIRKGSVIFIRLEEAKHNIFFNIVDCIPKNYPYLDREVMYIRTDFESTRHDWTEPIPDPEHAFGYMELGISGEHIDYDE